MLIGIKVNKDYELLYFDLPFQSVYKDIRISNIKKQANKQKRISNMLVTSSTVDSREKADFVFGWLLYRKTPSHFVPSVLIAAILKSQLDLVWF